MTVRERSARFPFYGKTGPVSRLFSRCAGSAGKETLCRLHLAGVASLNRRDLLLLRDGVGDPLQESGRAPRSEPLHAAAECDPPRQCICSHEQYPTAGG